MAKEFLYLFGKFYDPSREKLPNPNSSYDTILYIRPRCEPEKSIASLDGFFLTGKNLEEYFDDGRSNVVIRRDQMKEFEVKHSGEFIPFNDLDIPTRN